MFLCLVRRTNSARLTVIPENGQCVISSSIHRKARASVVFKWLKEVGSGLAQVLAHEFSEMPNDLGVVVLRLLRAGHCLGLSPKCQPSDAFSSWRAKNHSLKIRIKEAPLFPTQPARLCCEWGRTTGKQMGTGPWAASGTQPQNYTCRFLGERPELGFAHLLPVETVDQPLFLAWFSPYVWMTVVLPGTVPEHWAYVNYLLVTPGAFNCSYMLHNWQQQHLKLPGTGAAPRGFEG